MNRVTIALLAISLAGCATSQSGPTPPVGGSAPILQPNAGVVSTLSVQSKRLEDITADAQGNLYLAELDAIRKVGPDGQITTLATVKNEVAFPGVDLETTISNPRSIAVDRQGTLYLSGYQRTWKLTPDGRVTSLPGVQGETASGLAVDGAGNVYMAVQGTDTIHRLGTDGQVSLYAGRNIRNQVGPGTVGAGYLDGPREQALFRMPTDLAVDASGNLYVADWNNGAIRRIDAAGNVTTLVGQGKDVLLPSSPPPDQPRPDVSPYLAGRVTVKTLAVDSAGFVYAAGSDNYLRRISPTGQVSLLAGDGTHCPGVAITTGAGTRSSASPSPTPNCHVDGAGAQARFDQPAAIAVDGAGRVYVLDGGDTYDSRRLRKVQ
jgi:hypothetical protein